MVDERRESDGPQGRDRRRHDRRPAVRFIWYKLVKEDIEETKYTTEGISKMCDLSSSGMGIYVTSELPVGELIFIEMAAKEFGMSAIGEIVNVRKSDENRSVFN